jgi:hypothetical protein
MLRRQEVWHAQKEASSLNFIDTAMQRNKKNREPQEQGTQYTAVPCAPESREPTTVPLSNAATLAILPGVGAGGSTPGNKT